MNDHCQTPCRPGHLISVRKIGESGDTHNSATDESVLQGGHHICGFLLTPLRVGEPIIVWEKNRDDRVRTKIFFSTPLIETDGLIYRTEESLWIILDATASSETTHPTGPKIRRGRPVQCRRCGSIIKTVSKLSDRPICRCGLSLAPAVGDIGSDNEIWIETDVRHFIDPKNFEKPDRDYLGEIDRQNNRD